MSRFVVAAILAMVAFASNSILCRMALRDMRDAALMIVAGIAWGIYSLLGRRSSDALSDSAGNFVRTTPGVLLVSVVLWRQHSRWPP
jgi:hypothetical protein